MGEEKQLRVLTDHGWVIYEWLEDAQVWIASGESFWSNAKLILEESEMEEIIYN